MDLLRASFISNRMTADKYANCGFSKLRCMMRSIVKCPTCSTGVHSNGCSGVGAMTCNMKPQVLAKLLQEPDS